MSPLSETSRQCTTQSLGIPHLHSSSCPSSACPCLLYDNHICSHLNTVPTISVENNQSSPMSMRAWRYQQRQFAQTCGCHVAQFSHPKRIVVEARAEQRNELSRFRTRLRKRLYKGPPARSHATGTREMILEIVVNVRFYAHYYVVSVYTRRYSHVHSIPCVVPRIVDIDVTES